MSGEKRGLDELRGIYGWSIDKVLAELNKDARYKTPLRYQTEVSRTLKKVQQEMDKGVADWAKTYIPTAYRQGVSGANAQLTKAGKNIPAFKGSKVHEAGEAEQVEDATLRLKENNRYMRRNLERNLKQAVRSSLKGETKGQGVKAVQRLMMDQIKKKGIKGYKKRNGNFVRVESQAKMLGGAAMHESRQQGMIKQGSEAGCDLVMIVPHSPTCGMCAKYHGRVYSVSGKDKRFPALYETAFKSGYNKIHPNCRHKVQVVDESSYSEAELERLQKDSNKPFLDTRTQVEKDRYDAVQRAKGERRRRLRASNNKGHEGLEKNLDKQYSVLKLSKKVNNDINIPEPMNEKRYNAMKSKLEARGVEIRMNKETDRYLDAVNAEAQFFDSGLIMVRSGRVPSASAFFEEVIHWNQENKYGTFNGDMDEYYKREIEANEMLKKNAKAYGFTQQDYDDITRNLNNYKKNYTLYKESKGDT